MSGEAAKIPTVSRTAAVCTDVCALPTNEAELRKLLSPEQYEVVRKNGTERPFANAYWNNHKDGVYVDVVGGEPLFTSKDKFDSGTGWPSYTRPIDKASVKEITDSSHGMTRVEVRSATADSHLGHVFDDGPAPTGLRYCINSASLKFIPVEEMDAAGLADLRAQIFPETVKTTDSAVAAEKRAVAMFGAGCFWGVEETFRSTPGVLATAVGYSGGHTKNPTYKEVCTDTTGHAEVVRVEYDPSKVTYDQLLDIFWANHNPTTKNSQGPDYGSQYRSVVFTTNDEQREAALASKERLDKSGKWRKPVVTEIVPAGEFYMAEDYHQQYLKKRGLSVCH